MQNTHSSLYLRTNPRGAKLAKNPEFWFWRSCRCCVSHPPVVLSKGNKWKNKSSLAAFWPESRLHSCSAVFHQRNQNFLFTFGGIFVFVALPKKEEIQKHMRHLQQRGQCPDRPKPSTVRSLSTQHISISVDDAAGDTVLHCKQRDTNLYPPGLQLRQVTGFNSAYLKLFQLITSKTMMKSLLRERKMAAARALKKKTTTNQLLCDENIL